jgi:periplasmic divalent cation tolerance protein
MDEARKITEILVGERLAACVSIVPQVHSTYWWKGKIERADEALLVIKTEKKKFAALARRIQQAHSYTVPEILALPVIKGNPDYLEWIKESLTHSLPPLRGKVRMGGGSR